MNAVYMLGIITNRGMRDKFIQFFKLHNIHVTLTVLGEGTANSAICIPRSRSTSPAEESLFSYRSAAWAARRSSSI